MQTEKLIVKILMSVFISIIVSFEFFQHIKHL